MKNPTVSGPERLEQAVSAYVEALKEHTRERVPLDWAMTQNNLGNALWTLGERERGRNVWSRRCRPMSRPSRNTPASACP